MSTSCIVRQKVEKDIKKRKIEKGNKKAIKIFKQYDLSIKKSKEEPKEIKANIDLENQVKSLLLPLFSIKKAECQDLEDFQ